MQALALKYGFFVEQHKFHVREGSFICFKHIFNSSFVDGRSQRQGRGQGQGQRQRQRQRGDWAQVAVTWGTIAVNSPLHCLA